MKECEDMAYAHGIKYSHTKLVTFVWVTNSLSHQILKLCIYNVVHAFIDIKHSVDILQACFHDWIMPCSFSVGEPLNKEAWQWYYSVVGEKRCTVVDTYWQTGMYIHIQKFINPNLGVSKNKCKGKPLTCRCLVYYCRDGSFNATLVRLAWAVYYYVCLSLKQCTLIFLLKPKISDTTL